MTTTLLYLHLLSLALLLMNSGAVHLLEIRAGMSQTVGEARRLLQTAVALGPVFGIGSALLAITGLTLARRGDESFSLESGWIVSAFIALVVINAVGAGFIGPRVARHAARLEGEGPVTPAAWELIHDRAATLGGWFNTGVALSAILLMVAKPGGVELVYIPILGALIGLGVGQLQHTITGRNAA